MPVKLVQNTCIPMHTFKLLVVNAILERVDDHSIYVIN